MASAATGAERVRRRRDKMRAAGLRPVQLWLPDTRADGFIGECARQSQLVREAAMPDDRIETDDWFDASDKSGWTA